MEDQPRRKGMGVQAEIGALDEGQVKKAFESASKKLVGCYGKGAARVPYLAGEVSFKLRVTQEGRAKWIYIKDSTLGDRATEDCMLGVLKGLSWPTPVDGQEGLAENSFAFEPGSDERMPVSWSSDQLGDGFRQAKGKLSQCKSSAGAGPMKATLYVATDGKAEAIGVSSSDEKGEAAVACVVETLSGITFASPGSFAAKVSVAID